MIGFWVSIIYEACSLVTGQCDTVHMERAPVYSSVARWDNDWCKHAGVFFAEHHLRNMPLPAYDNDGHGWRVVDGTVECVLVASNHETVN
jgi:hypothetical protein